MRRSKKQITQIYKTGKAATFTDCRFRTLRGRAFRNVLLDPTSIYEIFQPVCTETDKEYRTQERR